MTDAHAMMDETALLESGNIHWFSEWRPCVPSRCREMECNTQPCGNVPATGSIVYTIWGRDFSFIYVGMSGRKGNRPGAGGPAERLKSHASGRRSGDQFCVYVADRFVMIKLANRLGEIADGSLSLDQETKLFIREQLGFRWVAVPDHRAAHELEDRIRKGALAAGVPLLNPWGRKSR
jgi:hypothetical protein